MAGLGAGMQVVMRHDRDFFAGSVVILFVIAGLAGNPSFPTRLLWRWRDSGWTPRMTVNIRFGATSIRKR
jgi:hypothetical protein